jgi:hypothetical protein
VHAGVAVASTTAVGVFLVGGIDPGIEASRDVLVAGGISLTAAVIASTTAAAIEAARVGASATDAVSPETATPATKTNADGERR